MEVTLKTLFGLKCSPHSLELDFSHCCIRGTGQSVLSVRRGWAIYIQASPPPLLINSKLIFLSLFCPGTSPVAQAVKCLPTTRETWVRSLGWEDLLEKEMATHSSIIAWKIPQMEEPGRLQSMGLQRVGHD